MYRVTAFSGKTVGLFDQIKGLLGRNAAPQEAFMSESAETTVERRKRPASMPAKAPAC
jgi:hypothetical protein